MAATDLAEWLVVRGMPFREAHAVVGALVRRHLAGEGGLAELAAEALDAEAAALVRPGVGVRRRTSPGGAGPAVIGAQIESYRSMLEPATASPRCQSQAFGTYD